jgi:hypothetical protein
MSKAPKKAPMKSLTARIYEMACYANDGQKCRIVIDDGNGGEVSWYITGDELADIHTALKIEEALP